MDRLMVMETPPLLLDADGAGGYAFTATGETDYRTFAPGVTTAWVHEQVVNLQGYSMQDLTTYFRQSFEQTGGFRTVTWSATTAKPLVAFNAVYAEVTIVSTVPFTDDNIASALFVAPGFTPFSSTIVNFGNFNRDQIIHGRYCVYGIDTVLGSDQLDADGAGYNRVVQEYDFSSLEPVAVDKLYVYRILSFPGSFQLGGAGRFASVSIPAKRILLDSMADKEDELPYLMRLKRGYELANQV